MMPAKAPHKHPGADLDHPSLYINRELSHLEFQRRVLEEARDPGHPLLERVKFLSILGSNLDEFFMVRVAGLMQQIENGVHEVGLDGRSPAETLHAVGLAVRALVDQAYEFLRTNLIPALEENAVAVVDLSGLDPAERTRLDAFFFTKVFPVLTPLAFDPGRPWPHISNLSLSVAVTLRDPEGAEHFARLKIPDTLPQLVPVEQASTKGQAFLWIEQLVIANLHHLFPGLEIVGAHMFHVTRDAEVAIKELETDDLLETIEEAVWQRRFRDVVRLQVDADMPESMVQLLAGELEIESSDIFRV